jgi:hypothetical protein
MRRIYVLLTGALIAATLVALAVAPAGAISTQDKFAAIVINEQTTRAFTAQAPSGLEAQKAAMQLCSNGSARDHYCEGTGWVKGGYITLWVETNTHRFPAWGYGWDDSWQTAKKNGEWYCEQRTKKQCYEKVATSTILHGKARGGSF